MLYQKKKELGARVVLGGYYRTATNLYEVETLGANGCVVVRDCVSEKAKCLGIEEFRKGYWLVRGPR